MTSKIEKLRKELETDDVGQKRYLMYHILDQVLESHHEQELRPEERISRLSKTDGYLYKLTQEFLTSSSTLEKERKLDKIMQHVE